MSNKIEITGSIKLIGETQEFSSGFTKRELVITTDEKYPQDIKVEVVKDNCQSLDNFSIGDNVIANLNIRGNEYNGKYYVNLNCWKLTADEHSQAYPAVAQLQAVDDGDSITF